MLVKNRLLILIGMVLFVQSGLESIVNNWMTSYITLHEALSTRLALWMLTLFVMVFTASRLLLRFLLISLRTPLVLWGAVTLILGGSLFLLLGNGITFLYLAVFCLGLGLAAGFPVWLGVAGELFRQWSGTAFSMIFALSVVGNSMINFGVGWTTAQGGMKLLPWVILICIGVYSILIFITLRLINSTKNTIK